MYPRLPYASGLVDWNTADALHWYSAPPHCGRGDTVAITAPASDSYRMDRMEQDVKEVLLEVRALANAFQAFQLAQPTQYISRREYDADLKETQQQLSGLQRKYTGLLVAAIVLLSGLVVQLLLLLAGGHVP